MIEASNDLMQSAEAMLRPQGDGVVVKFVTASGDADILIPFARLAGVIQLLAAATMFSGADGAVSPPAKHFAPIQSRTVALAAGQSPSEALLVVGLSGFDLTFAIPSRKFTDLAGDIARTAERLNASES
jgi:hypothetical protein